MLTKVDIEILGIKLFGQVILEQITGDLRGAKILEIYFDDNYGNKQLNLKREKGGNFLYLLLLKKGVRLQYSCGCFANKFPLLALLSVGIFFFFFNFPGGFSEPLAFFLYNESLLF